MPNQPRRQRRSLTNRGARGPSPQHYRPSGWAVLGVRLPEAHRRLVDHVALALGEDVTPSRLGRIAVERLLADLGFDLPMPEAVLPPEARAKIEAWLVSTDRVPDGPEPPGGTGGPAAGRAG
jgi:hypothetical protein